MYAVEVRDHIMIAHSLPGEVFGPAQKMHGATFVVDIGRAMDALKAILEPINYANLDEHAPFKGKGPTTTEFLARHIFQEMALKVRGGALGPHASGLTKLRVTLNESHVARAWCEGLLA